jgi:hypothetical protein
VGGHRLTERRDQLREGVGAEPEGENAEVEVQHAAAAELDPSDAAFSQADLATLGSASSARAIRRVHHVHLLAKAKVAGSCEQRPPQVDLMNLNFNCKMALNGSPKELEFLS